MTFSIVARCAETGEIGVGIASAIPCTGSISSYVRAQIGGIATQAWCNPYLGVKGLELLEGGLSATDALNRIIEMDPQRDFRQVGIVDVQGRSAAYTGSACTRAACHLTGDGYSIQGNMLASTDVIDAMRSAYLASAGMPISERLLAALLAGDEAGGDQRGKQSAAILIHSKELYPCLDIRVDDHVEPVRELARVRAIACRQLVPFVAGLPTETDWNRTVSPETLALLALSPDQRREVSYDTTRRTEP